MKRYGVPLLILVILIAGVWMFLPTGEETVEKQDSSAEPPEVVTMLSDKEGAPPSRATIAGTGGPPPEVGPRTGHPA